MCMGGGGATMASWLVHTITEELKSRVLYLSVHGPFDTLQIMLSRLVPQGSNLDPIPQAPVHVYQRSYHSHHGADL